jgi:hypothetical protein
MAEKRFIIEVRTKGFSRATRDFDNIEKSSKNFNKTQRRMRNNTKGLLAELGALRNKILVYTFAIGGAVGAMNRFISAASGFQDVQTRLVGLTGSVAEAEKAFDTFNQIAATTPFQLQDVVNAGAQLEAFGVNSQATLSAVTDLAAFMGTTATEAASALGRAFAGGAGAADILRERGILQIIKDSQGIKDLSKSTLPEFRRALLNAMVDPVAGIQGSSERLSKTFTGAVSNMNDAITRFAASIGEKLLPALTETAQSIEKAFREANIQRVAQFGTAVGTVAGFILIFNRRAKIMAATVTLMTGGITTLLKVLGALFGVALLDRILQANNNFQSLNTQINNNTTSTQNATSTMNRYIGTLQNQNIALGLTVKDNERLKTIMADLTLATLQLNGADEKRIQKTAIIFQAEQNLSKVLQGKLKIDRDSAIVGEFVIDTSELKTEAELKEAEAVRRLVDARLQLIDKGEQAITVNNAGVQSINALSSAMNQLKGGTKDASDMFAIFLRLAGSLVALTPGGATGGAILNLFAGLAHTGGLITNRGIQRFANGGMVQGQDNVPILAQAGEFVMRRDAVQNIGVDSLASMNRTGNAGGVNINISGNMIANDEFVRDTLIPEIQKVSNQGLA